MMGQRIDRRQHHEQCQYPQLLPERPQPACQQTKAQRPQQRQHNHHRIHAEHGNARRSRKISRRSEGVELLKGTHVSGGSFRCLIGNAGW